VKVYLVLLTFAAVLLGTILCTEAAEKSATARDFSWIEQRVQELQPKAKEKRFDEIGWAKDILTAEKLAKENNRPVFLFTHDGRMNIGRC
jgi:imidazoleglycerol phosphate synthase glutamine amidotransferase subunit HisH